MVAENRRQPVQMESGRFSMRYALIVFGGKPPVCSPGSLGKGVSNWGGSCMGGGGFDVRALIAPGGFTGG